MGYVDKVFQMVLKGMDVGQICVQLDFCNQMKSVLPFESRLTSLLKSHGNLMSYHARKASEDYNKFPLADIFAGISGQIAKMFG